MPEPKRRAAIVGAGAGGLAAAFDLLEKGWEVTVFDGAEQPGGLASGFKDPSWEWPLEKFYHHWFQSDSEILRMIRLLGAEDRLMFPRPLTAFWHPETRTADVFDSPLAVLKYPHLSWPAKFRFGLAGMYLRKTKNWKSLEKVTADYWLRSRMGSEVYESLWRPMLIGKFGNLYKSVNMAWFWARIASRTPSLGYFKGGFQGFFDLFMERVKKEGGRFSLNTKIESIRPNVSGQVNVSVGGKIQEFDAVLSTSSPGQMTQLAPDLPASYLGGLRNLKSLGAVVAVFALKKSLLEKFYWLNLPVVGEDKEKSRTPFLALVQHTNLVDRSHYAGDHLIYCGDYLLPDHPHMTMDSDKVLAKFSAALPEFNSSFDPSWIRASWLWRSAYAQPLPEINHSKNIPEIRTPLRGVYFASMSQVYPWDRGTNYAVEIGRKAASIMAEDQPKPE